MSKKTKEMIERLFIRSVILLIMTVGGFFAMDWLIEAVKVNHSELVDRYPEVMMVLSALAVMAWIDVSVLWMRVTLQPNLDTQAFALAAMKDPSSAAKVYLIQSAMIIFRIVLVLKLARLL